MREGDVTSTISVSMCISLAPGRSDAVYILSGELIQLFGSRKTLYRRVSGDGF